MAFWIAALELAPTVVRLGEIAVSALPHFTKKKTEAIEAAEKTTQEQISELQSAATENAENIRTVAADLEAAINAIEQASNAMESRYRRLSQLTYLSLGVAALSAGGLVILLLR